MARQLCTVNVTTLHPVKPGLSVRVVDVGNETNVLVDDVLDSGGAFKTEVEADPDTIVYLLLSEKNKELIRCRVPIHALNPMECYMTNPPKLSEDELHKRWRAKYREMMAKGVKNPDPDIIGRHAFKY